jgi:hypothetical protein
MASYVETLAGIAGHDKGAAAVEDEVAEAEGKVKETRWEGSHRLLTWKFREENAEEYRIAVPFLQTFSSDKPFRIDADNVE